MKKTLMTLLWLQKMKMQFQNKDLYGCKVLEMSKIVSEHPDNNQSILILFVSQDLKLSVMYKDFDFGKPSCSADELEVGNARYGTIFSKTWRAEGNF